MSTTKSNTYKSILKGSAIFGGAQVISIFISLVRAKLIAILLGPAGMGLSSLLTNTTNIIQQFSSFGVNLTAVKDISQAEASKTTDIKKTLLRIRFLIIFLGGIGGMVCLLFSRQLSVFTFRDTKHASDFALLSIFIFLTTVLNGEQSILQGKGQLKKIAISGILSSILSLVVGVPLYYFLGLQGIVPAMIIVAAATLVINLWLNRDNLNYSYSNLKNSNFFSNSKRMISLGTMLMMATILGNLVVYLLNIYIKKSGGLDDVGFFQGANSITNQYIGLVFTAMAADYFPKLSAVVDDVPARNIFINSQFEVVILIVAPIALCMMTFASLVVHLLLSKTFMVVVPIIIAMAFGVLLKAASYPLGYISFAKGDKKLFFWMEGMFGNGLQLSLNVGFYYFFGLEGLGYSFIAIYIIYLCVMTWVTKRRYGFIFQKKSMVVS